MKIALVSPYDWAVSGGVNNHIRHLAERFVELGHQPHIVAPGAKQAVSAICPITTIGRPIPLRVSGSIARITLSLRTAGKVKGVLNDTDFDIVHVHEPFMPQLPIQFLRYSTTVNVGTWHAARASNFYYVYGRRLIQRWQRKLDGKIAVSTAAVKHIEKYFPGYYNIIPNGVDVEHFARTAEPLAEFNDGKSNVLFVGRPEKRKGLKYLIRAFVGVQRAIPDSRLIVVGAGGFGRYESAVRNARLRDVVFRSNVPFDELPRYHHTAHVFCAPNTGFESQGIVLLEAMAAGLPIVASNIDGFAGVVTHGVEGLLVRPEDPQALADALVELLRDPERSRAMAEHGRERAQYFSWDRVSQQVLSYYERLMYERQLAERSGTAASERQPIDA
ncbi:MAG: glycosyltransferase family 1 protein [Dehalococcoidia bacterium]|nr:MAG: glycosyltransferase family 1 protein [Dehalococcoidia bacterium]